MLACLALILTEIFIYSLAAADSVSDIRVNFFELPAWTHGQGLSRILLAFGTSVEEQLHPALWVEQGSRAATLSLLCKTIKQLLL